jgi:tRNA (Thr-GGU) A37 N-methylase
MTFMVLTSVACIHNSDIFFVKLSNVERGLFATRVPARPNPIGMSAVKLISVEGRRLHVEGVDMLDHTPLLDIKPYVREFDAHPDSLSGWFEKGRATVTVADDRFADSDRGDASRPGGNQISRSL